MENGLGDVQSIVLFGGTSDIGLAIVRRLMGQTTRRVILVSRDQSAAQMATKDIEDKGGCEISHVHWDARDVHSAEAVVASVTSLGDVDLAIVAVGWLDEGRNVIEDRTALGDMAAVNFTSPLIVTTAIAAHMKEQGYGRIVVLSSVAGVRPRRANPIYGATKAGIDGYSRALDHLLSGSGVRVLVVRPGFVKSKMTRGLPNAPFSTTPDNVAASVQKAVRADSSLVWSPGILRWVFGVLRLLPESLWRRLPL